MRLVTLFTLLLITFKSVFAHELHLSVTNIDFVGDSAKISIRMIDNNQFHHLAQCYPDVSLAIRNESIEGVQEFMFGYFRKTFRL